MRREIAPQRKADGSMYRVIDAYIKFGTVERVTAEQIAKIHGYDVTAVRSALDWCVSQGRAQHEGEYYFPLLSKQLLEQPLVE